MAANARYGVDLRRVVLADAGQLAALLVERPDQHVLARRIERVLAAETATGLVATDYDGTLIGIITLHWHDRLQSDAPVATITSFIVAESERRRGVGRVLLKAASQAARAAGCDTLLVHLPDEAAATREFCRQTGFVKYGDAFSRTLRKRAASV